MEKGNKQLIAILEKYDEKVEKLKEEAHIQALKMEKYEAQLTGEVPKIDTDTLDGRVNFLVSLLEDYKRELEDLDDDDEIDLQKMTAQILKKSKKSPTNSQMLEML